MPPMSEKSIYEADLRLYKSNDIADMFTNEGLGDWDTVQGKVDMSGDNVHELMLKLKSQDYKTNQDGTYEIYVLPGTYDLLIDAVGYLDCVYVNRTLLEGDTMDLGYHVMLVGDLNKSGLVDIKDTSLVGNTYGAYVTDAKYQPDYDFNKDDYINIKDTSYVGNNFLKIRELIK